MLRHIQQRASNVVFAFLRQAKLCEICPIVSHMPSTVLSVGFSESGLELCEGAFDGIEVCCRACRKRSWAPASSIIFRALGPLWT